MNYKLDDLNINKVENSFFLLKKYCEKNNFSGIDPFDGLNSPLIYRNSIFFKSKWLKLIWLQFNKKSPINFRKLLFIKPEINPKSLGIFLTTYCKIYKHYKRSSDLYIIDKLISDILSTRCTNYTDYCWGYPFDWQSISFYHPKNTPTVVSSSFVALSLLNAYEILGHDKLLDAARSTAEFIKKELNRKYDSNMNFIVSYSPIDNTFVYNASFLASQLFSRLYHFTKVTDYKEFARCMIVYCCNKQHPNGSWYYGESKHHQWIDSFHTGYNIESLYTYQQNCSDDNFNNNIFLSLDFYLRNLFTSQGIPKYYFNKIYPIDIHSSAQLIITLSQLRKLNRFKIIASRVLRWTIYNMQSNEGYFYYQKYKYYINKIPYMRWSQSWMLYALISYIENFSKPKVNPDYNYGKLFDTNQILTNSN